MRHHLVVALCLLGSGCSLWNAPDPGLLDGGPPDGGMPIDAPIDAPREDARDAPLDTPVLPERETACSDDLDDDGDGATDCVDTDCASEARCCTVNPTPVVEERWCDPGLPSAWTARAGILTSTGSGCPGPDGRLGGTGSTPSVAFHDACVPLAAGATFRLAFDWIGGDCADCEATVALSPVAEAGPTGIVEDLAVRMHGLASGLEIQLVRAGTVLAQFPVTTGTHDLVLTLFPALNDAGQPVLRALMLAEGGRSYGPFDALDFPSGLLGQPDCPVAPGLFLGVQTRGANASLGPIRVNTAQCANPNYFRPVGGNVPTWLEAADVGFTSQSWVAGGIGSGSVVPVVNGGTVEWSYFVDGSPSNRANDRDTDLDFSLGGARSPDPGLDGFELRADGEPLVGPLRCGDGCDVRDPTAFFPRMTTGVLPGGIVTGQLLWTERDDAARTSAIYRADFSSPNDRRSTPNTSVTMLELGCARAERPSLLTEDPTGASGHLLVFLCDGQLAAVPLNGAFEPMGTPTRLESLGRALGFTRDLVDVDGAVFGETYRIWVAGRDERGLTRIALAEGVIREGTVPSFVPFAGNPILSIDDPLLADGCTGVCTLTGVGVGRLPADGSVRVVLSVTDEAGGGARHVLIPLEQDMPVAP